MIFPQSNAQLLSISRGSLSEDYDRPSGSLSPIWTGNEDAYVSSRILGNFDQRGELNRILATTIIIPGDLPVKLQGGDILTYLAGDPDSPTVRKGRVQTFTNPAELAYLPDYYKIALEEVEAS